jgi:hypothetical protein
MVVFCPISCVSNWNAAAEHFGLTDYTIHTYSSFTSKSNMFIDSACNVQPRWTALLRKDNVKSIVVFDEAHVLKNDTLQHAKCRQLSRQAVLQNCGIILLSGTPIDGPAESVRIMKILQIIKQDSLSQYIPHTSTHRYEGYQDLIDFCQREHIVKDISLKTMNQNVQHLAKTYVKPMIFRAMVLPEIPSNVSNYFAILTPDDYEIVHRGVELLERAIQLEGIERTRYAIKAAKTIEYGKLNVLLDMTIAAINTGQKVVVCLNFKDNIAIFYDRLIEELPNRYGPDNIGIDPGVRILSGAVKKQDRIAIVESFQEQNWNTRILVCNPQVIAMGMDLDDKTGDFPRTMIISPIWFLIRMEQVSCRIRRCDTIGTPTIRMLYAKKLEREMMLYERLYEKTKNLKDFQVHDFKLLSEYEIQIENPEGVSVISREELDAIKVAPDVAPK